MSRTASALRVLVVTHVFPRTPEDPSAPFLLRWAQALSAAGADVAVIAPHDAGLPARQVVGGIPVRLVRYAPARWERLAYRGEMHQLVRRPSGPLVLSGLVAAMAAAVRRQEAAGRPDVVHVHWWVPCAMAVRLARMRTPTVLTVHGTDVALVESRPRAAALARWAMGCADRVEAVSSDLAARVASAVGRPADAVNPMPLDPGVLAAPAAAARRGAGGPLQVLAVGRMVPEKRFADLVSAMAVLPFDARLVLVGDGPERPALQEQAQLLGVPTHFPGRLSAAQLRDAYLAADVVVQPSQREGLGLVAAEALVLGVPVVATDSGGARDVLDRRDLVAVGDVRALVDAIAAVAADARAARAHAAELGRRLRRHLSPEAAAERTLAGYRTLLGR